jgi:hypothetical protein
MKATLLVLVLAAMTATVRAQHYADSVVGYSGTQGGNGWWYGYYDVSDDVVPGYDATNDFRQFPYWDGAEWYLTNSAVASLSAYNEHPSGATNTPGNPLREQWAVRRWVSTITDTVKIYGHAAKQNIQCGDGVRIMVMVNGRKVINRTLTGGDGVGFDYSIGVQLHTNDLVDFVVTAGCCGDAACDGTQFTALIDYANFTLDVRTAVEVGVQTSFDQKYQMQQSSDFQTWQSIGDPFTGTGDTMYFLFSTRQIGSARYFRAQAIP